MPVSEKKLVTNARYTAKCNRIEIKPLQPVGTDIRAAAQASGMSLQGYILHAIRNQMERDGFQPEAEWPCDPA